MVNESNCRAIGVWERWSIFERCEIVLWAVLYRVDAVGKKTPWQITILQTSVPSYDMDSSFYVLTGQTDEMNGSMSIRVDVIVNEHFVNWEVPFHDTTSCHSTCVSSNHHLVYWDLKDGEGSWKAFCTRQIIPSMGINSISLQSPDIQHIIPPNKAITVLPLQLTIGIFLRLFQCDIHITIQAR